MDTATETDKTSVTGATMNREQWLEQAVSHLEPLIKNHAELSIGTVKVSCGFPASRALASKVRRIGECWHQDVVDKENAQVFISPLVNDSIEVLGVLLHELGHAALPAKTGHKSAFKKFCKNVGLQGKPTSTEVSTDASDPLRIRLSQIVTSIGDYPHKAWEPAAKKKQTTRLRLYVCDCENPIKLRVASDSLDATCNVCESVFKQP